MKVTKYLKSEDNTCLEGRIMSCAHDTIKADWEKIGGKTMNTNVMSISVCMKMERHLSDYIDDRSWMAYWLHSHLSLPLTYWHSEPSYSSLSFLLFSIDFYVTYLSVFFFSFTYLVSFVL